MAIVMLCVSSALIGYCIGMLMADRIADHKIAEMRMQMGLDIDTGQPIDDEDDLYKR